VLESRSSRPHSPDGWITRDEVIAATGVSDRNLLNWCVQGFVPRPTRGSVALYRAEAVAMIRRLYELQRQGRDADAWLWGLWLDSANYPVDIRQWILRRLNHALKAIKAIGDHPDEVERHVDGALKQRKLTRKLHRRGINPSHLRDLVLWAYRVAADVEQQERLDNPGSPILDTLRRVGGLTEKGFPAPDRKLGVELMAVAWLHEVIEKASPDALEQLRRDCRAIGRLAELAESINWRAVQPAMESTIQSVIGGMPEPPSVRARKEARKRPPVPVIVRSLMSPWGEFDTRAIVMSGLIVFRQSPEHGKRITEILALATCALELAAQYPESSR
jgi:hypothetical protein